MLKRVATIVCVVCVAVGAATAAVTKIRGFLAAGPGLSENPDTDGMAIVKYEADIDATVLNLHVTDLAPNTHYGVRFSSSFAEFSDPQAFTTNPAGNGSYQKDDIPGDSTAGVTITIYLWDGNTDPDAIDLVTASELRAVNSTN